MDEEESEEKGGSKERKENRSDAWHKTGKVSSNSKAVENRKRTERTKTYEDEKKKHAVNKEVLWNLRILETSCRRRRLWERKRMSCAKRERNPMKPRNLSGILQDNLWAAEMRRAGKFYKLKVWKTDWKKCQNDSIENRYSCLLGIGIKITCTISCYYYILSVFKNFYRVWINSRNYNMIS